MTRTKPATFHATDANGRRWKIRVSPNGIEAITHQADKRIISGMTFTGGQQRFNTTWRDLLPPSVDSK